MITVEFIIGVICLTIAITSGLFFVVIGRTRQNINYIWAILPCTVLIMIGSLLTALTPKEKDVLDNRAHYVEVYHVYKNDTIKTYHLVWNNKPTKK